MSYYLNNPELTPGDRGESEDDKWASWDALRSPAYADKWLREQRGIELHAGSTKEEIDRAVRMYRASW